MSKNNIGSYSLIYQDFGERSSFVALKNVDGGMPVPTGTKPTKTSSKAIQPVQKFIKSVAESFSEEIQKLSAINGPKDVEVEFGLTFSQDLKVWGIGVGGEESVKVTLRWSKAE